MKEIVVKNVDINLESPQINSAKVEFAGLETADRKFKDKVTVLEHLLLPKGSNRVCGKATIGFFIFRAIYMLYVIYCHNTSTWLLFYTFQV